MDKYTIAAVATGMSNAGIGIIRVSGDESFSIVDRVYWSCLKGGNSKKKSLLDFESHTINYGYIYDGDELIDEVMVSVMKAPRSFTTEDTVEINCHGGVLVVNKILELVIKNGARLASPGEFTKRAFLNGRIDLSKAEAIMDIIHSNNEYALKNSVSQLKGSISNVIKELRSKIIYEVAFIESALDDPEHISLDGYSSTLSTNVSDMVKIVDKLIKSSDNGVILKEGIHTVIVGKPNAGKSSFLNTLIGQDKAIVTDIAGTTRDILEENININGISLNMIDTAGIRDTNDVIEKIGVEKAKNFAGNADLIIYVIDASVPFDESDLEIMELIKDKKTIILLNKSDLETVIDETVVLDYLSKFYDYEIELVENHGTYFIEDICMIKTSTKDYVGIDVFEEVIHDLFFQGKIDLDNEMMITNLRHKEALIDCKQALELVLRSIEDEMPEDFYSIDLMTGYASLGYIIGEEVTDDLVTEIFSKFCMGK